jgi:Zn-dependent metalloprotease
MAKSLKERMAERAAERRRKDEDEYDLKADLKAKIKSLNERVKRESENARKKAETAKSLKERMAERKAEQKRKEQAEGSPKKKSVKVEICRIHVDDEGFAHVFVSPFHVHGPRVFGAALAAAARSAADLVAEVEGLSREKVLREIGREFIFQVFGPSVLFAEEDLLDVEEEDDEPIDPRLVN